MASVLKGKMALVTGASGGIGLELCRLLAAESCDLVMVARSSDKLQGIKQELESRYGIKAHALPCDLAKAGAAGELHELCLREGYKVDVLVNNAGVGLFGPILGQDCERVQAMVSLNVVALTQLCLLFGNEMAKSGGGRILNIGSMVGLLPIPFFSTYAASKAYVRSFSSSLRAELRPRGIKVSCLMPGFVRTGFDSASSVESKGFLKLSASMGMDPLKVARKGLSMLKSGRVEAIPGLSNKISGFFMRLLPKNPTARITQAILKRII